MKKNIVFFIVIILFFIPIYSQAVDISPIDLNSIGNYLAGEGVTISNVQLTYQEQEDRDGNLVSTPIGDSTKQIAYFNGAAGQLPGFYNMNEGIVLSTGLAMQAFYPTPQDTSWSTIAQSEIFSTPVGGRGDYELDEFFLANKSEYAGSSIFSSLSHNEHPTTDAISIEFDAVSDSEYLSFQYIFATLELEQSNIFNDIFALYINGENMAKLPNGNYVNVNNIRGTQYVYTNNGIGFPGYTSLLSCNKQVKPGEVNHVRLVIADVSDKIYDSAIYIKARSFSNKEQACEENSNSGGSIAPSGGTTTPSGGTTIPSGGTTTPSGGTTTPQVDIYLADPTVEKRVSKITIKLADGRILNSVELDENGQSLSNLNGAFIADGVYFIMDNEIIHGATIEIEYKIKVKNNSRYPCTKLQIFDYLDEEMFCNSSEWVFDSSVQAYKLELVGDWTNPVIDQLSEKEFTIQASKVLAASDRDYEFLNDVKAITTIANTQTQASTSAQPVNVIPPFGVYKNINIIKVFGFLIILFVLTISRKINLIKK